VEWRQIFRINHEKLRDLPYTVDCFAGTGSYVHQTATEVQKEKEFAFRGAENRYRMLHRMTNWILHVVKTDSTLAPLV
jgi:hypothetical protein